MRFFEEEEVDEELEVDGVIAVEEKSEGKVGSCVCRGDATAWFFIIDS